MSRVTLKRGKDELVAKGHPWVFSGAVKEAARGVKDGDIVNVQSHSGKFIGKGFYNSISQIAVRMLTLEDIPIDTDFFAARIRTAAFLRQDVLKLDLESDAYRLVNSEGDMLPGLTIDKYGDHVVVKFSSLGMKLKSGMVKELIIDILKPASISEKADQETSSAEGMALAEGPIYGEVAQKITIREGNARYLVYTGKGQKTGFFLDQRANRNSVSRYAAEKSVLDVFSYTGGFGIAAARAGARSVRFIEESDTACGILDENLKLNDMDKTRAVVDCADAFQKLREIEKSGDRYGLAILDPPSFTKRKKDLMNACRGYKDVNLLAMKVLEKGGILATFSCSHHISEKLFGQVVWEAAVDSKRQCQVLEILSQPADHPVNIFHREGRYLKGLILRVL